MRKIVEFGGKFFNKIFATQNENKYFVKKAKERYTDEEYEIIVKNKKKVGEGTFGIVITGQIKFSNLQERLRYLENISQINKQRGELKMKNITTELFAIKTIPVQTEYKSRELDILKEIEHPNIITLRFYFLTQKREENKVLTFQNFVMEYVSLNLQNEILFYKKHQQDFPIEHLQYIMFQLARSLLYLHGIGISHRDIKPSNILIDPVYLTLKICDFGSAKKLDVNERSITYICSRYYRAPELIFDFCNYTSKIDIWGFGAILAELFLKYPIFLGKTSETQINEIFNVLGPPPSSFYEKYQVTSMHISNTKKEIKNFPKKKLEERIKNASPDAIDLISNTLEYDPDDRDSPKNILTHSFFEDLKKKDKVIYSRFFNPIDKTIIFNFSNFELKLLGSLESELKLK